MESYRTEELYGEGYRDCAAVMAHEIFELQNTDILETLSTTIFQNTDIGKELNYMMQVMEEELDDQEINDFLDEAFENQEIAIKYTENILQNIISPV